MKTPSQEISIATQYIEQLTKIIVAYTPKLLSAFLILFIGLYAVRFINRLARKIMLKRELDPTLSQFLANILLWALRILLFVTFISKLGVETSSFVAILGAAGLAIGMSLQGSLSNFAGGMLIILFKPFRVGDTIEAQNQIGTVDEIQIFVTKLISANNQVIFIPNGILSNGTIINYTLNGKRRIDLVFSLSYNTDIKKAKEIITNVILSNEKVLKEPVPTVSVKDLTDTAIHIAIRPWTNNEDSSEVSSQILEHCKIAFDQEGISIQPFIRENSH